MDIFKVNSILPTLYKRRFNVFYIDDETFFATKKQKMFGYDARISVSLKKNILNFTIDIHIPEIMQKLRANKMVLMDTLKNMKIPFWFAYESIMNDLRKTMYDFITEKTK